MADAVKFDCFARDLGLAKHDFSTHTFKVALTNAAPDPAADAVLADLTEIAAGNGYAAGGPAITISSFAEVGGVAAAVVALLTLTASGGAIGPYQYAVLYNATTAGGPLIAYWARPAATTLQDGDSQEVNPSDASDRLIIIQ